MCEFISWKECKTKDEKVEILFLTAYDIYNTKRGEELQKHTTPEDFVGHGAIDFYFEIESSKGTNNECTDFSTPDNFPPEIVTALKDGKFRGLGTPVDLLNELGLEMYKKADQSARAEYEKARQTVLAEYKKADQSARAEYKKADQLAWAEYEKVQQPAWEEYKKVQQPAWAEYEKAKQSAFWDIFADMKNRNPKWA